MQPISSTCERTHSSLITSIVSFVPLTDLPASSWQAQGPQRRSFCGTTRTGSSRGRQARGSFAVWSGSPSEPSADPLPPPLMSTVKHKGDAFDTWKVIKHLQD